MSADIPRVDSVSPPIKLLQIINNSSNSTLWIKERLEAPPKIEDYEIKKIDSWLMGIWPEMMLQFARAIGSESYEKKGWHEALKSDRLRSQGSFQSGNIGRLIWNTRSQTSQVHNAPDRALQRNQVCPFLREYFQPLFPRVASSQDELRFWLFSLINNRLYPQNIHLAERGFQSTGEWARAGLLTPQSVKQLEEQQNEEVMKRWLGEPPTLPEEKRQTRRPFSRFLDEVSILSIKGFTSQPIIQSEPSKIIDWCLTQSRIDQQVPRKYMHSRRYSLIIVPYKGGIAPANLYISQVEMNSAPFLFPMAVALLDTPVGSLFSPLMCIAYAIVAHALVPLASIYHNLDGTCVAEGLLPEQWEANTIIEEFLLHNLEPELKKLYGPINKEQISIIDSFKQFGLALLDKEKIHLDEFLILIQRQSGGRVLLPMNGFTSENGWRLKVNEPSDVDETNEIYLIFPELLRYSPIPQTKKQRDIFWILRSAWKQLRTATALINQSGVTLWITAGNNRWGGRHKPHRSHRRGLSIDVDVAYNQLVPNVMARRLVKKNKQIVSEEPLPDSEVRGNSSKPVCLFGMDRLALWITVQAFMCAGVSQYLYGDEGLIIEAAEHLSTRDDRLNVYLPAKHKGIWEPSSHHNHIHFEIARKILSRDPLLVSGTSSNGFTWMAQTDDLFSTLYELALERDNDPSFWSHMAGLVDDTGNETIPESEAEFDNMLVANSGNEGEAEKELWKTWWNRGRTGNGETNSPGIPLLPVWNPELAERTRYGFTCKTKIYPQTPEWGSI